MAQIETSVGWREWVSLPDLGIDAIKTKVDTGARTSCLHVFEMETWEQEDTEWVRFGLHPLQKVQEPVVECCCPVLDRRQVTDSGGRAEHRVIIGTSLALGGHCWPIEVSLTCRETMRFRMLLGRTAMKGLVVHPGASFLLGGDGNRACS